MTDFGVNIKDNLALLQERIHKALRRSGRQASEITLLAVTKTVSLQHIGEAWKLGLRHFGESRVQEAAIKRSETEYLGVAWHLIGHLQTNKARKALEIFDVIESLDSVRLAEQLERLAAEQNRKIRCFAEIKVSPEPSKQGLRPTDLESFLAVTAERCPHLIVEGLMTVAPYDEDPEKARPYFRQTRELFEKHRHKFRCESPRLSMGMSHDFEVAIEEGTHLIRIGTALFGQRQYSK
jgi:pyridoxal phosphate enzyme (YggS family)